MTIRRDLHEVDFTAAHESTGSYHSDASYSSLVPRPFRAIRVTRGGLEPSAIARGLAQNGKKSPRSARKSPR